MEPKPNQASSGEQKENGEWAELSRSGDSVWCLCLTSDCQKAGNFFLYCYLCVCVCGSISKWLHNQSSQSLICSTVTMATQKQKPLLYEMSPDFLISKEVSQSVRTLCITGICWWSPLLDVPAWFWRDRFSNRHSWHYTGCHGHVRSTSTSTVVIFIVPLGWKCKRSCFICQTFHLRGTRTLLRLQNPIQVS